MQILNLEQGSPQWIALRKTVITGTDTAMVMRQESWERLTREKNSTNSFKSAAMERGNRLEPQARAALELSTGLKYKPVCIIDREERMMVSLDGMAFRRVAICEIKCPEKGNRSELWKKAEAGKIPHDYYLQMQSGLLLSGAPVCHYWVYDADLNTGIKIDVYPDQMLHCDIIDSVRAYWDQEGVSPEEKTKASLKEVSDFIQLEAGYINLLAAKTRLEEQIKQMEAQILEYQVPGVDVSEGSNLLLEVVKAKGSIDYKEALKKHAPEIDLEAFRKEPASPSSTRIKLTNQAKQTLKKLMEMPDEKSRNQRTFKAA